MEYLLPLFGEVKTTVLATGQLPLYKEIDWDFHFDIPCVKDGEFVVVYGNDAIRVWIYKALQVQRRRYLIYSWGFGNDLEKILGTKYNANVVHAEVQRYLEIALLSNPYITGVQPVVVNILEKKLLVSFRTRTIYGEIDIDEVAIHV